MLIGRVKRAGAWYYAPSKYAPERKNGYKISAHGETICFYDFTPRHSAKCMGNGNLMIMGANLGGMGDVSPNIFMPHISELDDLFLHFGQEIDHLGSDDLFFGLYYISSKKLVIWEVITDDLFFVVFTSLHFTVVGKIWATTRGC